jgi:hypothetical protein
MEPTKRMHYRNHDGTIITITPHNESEIEATVKRILPSVFDAAQGQEENAEYDPLTGKWYDPDTSEEVYDPEKDD